MSLSCSLPLNGSLSTLGFEVDYDNPSYLEPPSYLYAANQPTYLYADDLEESSFLPVLKIDERKVIFTLNAQLEHAIYYGHTLISTVKEALQKIGLPSTLDQDLLNKIAIITNYLCQGKHYDYIENSAKLEGEGIIFLVKHKKHFCQVTLPSLKEECQVFYRED